MFLLMLSGAGDAAAGNNASGAGATLCVGSFWHAVTAISNEHEVAVRTAHRLAVPSSVRRSLIGIGAARISAKDNQQLVDRGVEQLHRRMIGRV